MQIVVRVNWLPASHLSIEERIAESAYVLHNFVNEPLGVATWFDTGRSKKDALTRSFSVESLRNKQKPWRRSLLVPGEWIWKIGLWNGRDDEETGTLSITLFDPVPDNSKPQPKGLESDTLLICGPSFSIGEQPEQKWVELLDMARNLASELGGLCIITSQTLWDKVEKAGWQRASAAVYAAFWGVDRSGENPNFRHLKEINQSGPFESIACRSWEEAQNPNFTELRKVSDLLW